VRTILTPAYPQPTLRERALDLMFPPTCVRCRKIGRWICETCWQQIDWVVGQKCGGCGRPWIGGFCPECSGAGTSLDSLSAVTAFRGVSREAVHALKYYGRHAIASMMARLMADAFTDFPIDRVSHVPLHPSRRRERGYDQAAMLARGIAALIDLPYEANTLRRVRRTRQQVTLSGEQRQRNVAGAFEAREQLDGISVLLVDDVITTGATMEAAAEAAREAGAQRVAGIAFASAQLGQDDPDTPVDA